MNDYYQMGRAAFRYWMTSRQFAQFDRNAPSTDIMRLFLPPCPADLMQIARPLPKSHQDWLRGFDEAKTGNDRVEGRDAASSRRVPSHDGLCGNVKERT